MVLSDTKYILLNKTKHILLTPQIIKLEVKEGEFIEMEDVAEMHAANLELSKGKPFCVLLDTSMGYFNTSSEARSRIASKEYAKVMLASAFVVNSLASKLTGNFYLKFNKPKAPTALFTNQKEALTWLMTFVEKANL